MNTRITRRTAIGLSPLALAACGRREENFGRSAPPSTQTLIYEIPAEPSGLDPAPCLAASEYYIWPALFARRARHTGFKGVWIDTNWRPS